MADDTVLTIESTRSVDDAPPACLLRWGAREWYASVPAVRQTAEDLFTCAAYADTIGELLRIGMDAPTVGSMTTAMLAGRKPRYFGSPDTLYVLPGGSSARKVGVVMLGRRNHFHRGEADGVLDAMEAREMGRVWLTAAEASEADTLFGAVLARSRWMAPDELDALFGLLSDIRAGEATVPPHVQ